jgi:glycosyltransferase involved in cell wall biosynthesis
MERRISLIADVRALLRLIVLLMRLRPAIVSTGTPKAGLLVGLAAALTRVPRRVYILHGLRVEGSRGAMRVLLWAMEWLACVCAHTVVCVSPSLRDRALALRVLPARKARVIRAGTSSGIDTLRFCRTRERTQAAAALRAELGISPQQTVIGFVGRLTEDKGITELIEAHLDLTRERGLDCVLLIVGQNEGATIEELPNVYVIGHRDDVATCYHAMDVLALPTYREGFPTVVLEAACAEVPAVVTDATGSIDSVVADVTGLIVPVKDSRALADALQILITETENRHRMGLAARERVARDFRPQDVFNGLVEIFRN